MGRQKMQENRGFQSGGAIVVENFAADFLQMQQTVRQHSAGMTAGACRHCGSQGETVTCVPLFDPLRDRLHYAGSTLRTEPPP